MLGPVDPPYVLEIVNNNYNICITTITTIYNMARTAIKSTQYFLFHFKYNIDLFISYFIEYFKFNQYPNFQLILPMCFHFMRYFVNSIIFSVSHTLLYYCVLYTEVDFET